MNHNNVDEIVNNSHSLKLDLTINELLGQKVICFCFVSIIHSFLI